VDHTRRNEAECASYTIYVDALDDNRIKAKNGNTGTIDYWDSSNTAKVINQAIAALAIVGGQIYIKRGVKTGATDTITIQDQTDLALVGEVGPTFSAGNDPVTSLAQIGTLNINSVNNVTKRIQI
jgi:hypothetical protein